MTVQGIVVQRESLTLAEHGLYPERILPNLTPPRLIEYALRREEGVVTDHGGTIRVEDNRPTGTVFTIELPQG